MTTITPRPRDDSALPRQRFSAAEVRTMIEAGVFEDKPPFELIDGDLVHMPSEGPRHWGLKTNLVNWMLRRLDPAVNLAPDGPLRLGQFDEPEPDLFLFPADMDVNMVRGCHVLLVVEVADTSLARDRDAKGPLYARYDVGETWVIDLNARQTHVMTDPASDGYRNMRRVSFDDPLSAPGVSEPLVLTTLSPTS